MKKKIFSIILMLITLITLTTNVHAASLGGYKIIGYNVDMIVGEDNVLDITETIDVFFNESRHGIYRDIPTKGTIKREDGSTGKFRAKISNISVNESYSTSTTFNGSESYKEIKIGDANSTVKGLKTYIIKYKYKLSDDKVEEFDELYFNIIGTSWDAYVSGISFNITMPKEYDAQKLGFTHGKEGANYTDGIEYQIDGNKITGRYANTLAPNEALTVRLELPQGYFVIDNSLSIVEKSMFVMFVIAAFISFVLWTRNGKDKVVVETVEFYPPEGMNSLDLAYAYKGRAEGSDVTSLLVYLANKGYLKIEENKGIFKSNSFKLVKVKEYDGNDEHEEVFFNGLFKDGDTVTASDLEDEFYKTQGKILRSINCKENREKIFSKESKKSKIINMIISAVVAILLVIVAINTLDVDEEFLFTLPFIAVGVIIAISGIVSIAKKNLTGIFLLIFGIVFSFPVVIVNMNIGDLFEYITPGAMALVVTGLISFAVTIFFTMIMDSRTDYGAQILGKIRGFKRFLENARKDELERLVIENPTYFYDILPYTYVLNVSKKWIEKFEAINIQSPDWYSGTDTFAVASFGRFMDTTMTRAESSMSSSPSSSGGGSSGGGSSGGGSSGGGSGGGGGGSW